MSTAAARPIPALTLSGCLSVADLDATATWYAEALGFHTVRRHTFAEFGAEVAYLSNGTLALELLQVTDGISLQRPAPPNHGALHGLTQLAFYVSDLDQTVRELRERGVEPVTDIADVPVLGVRALFVRDLEGHYIEFIQADWL